MSASILRGKVEFVNEFYTGVRMTASPQLMVFNHGGLNAAPVKLRVVGLEVQAELATDDPIYYLGPSTAVAAPKVPLRRAVAPPAPAPTQPKVPVRKRS